MIKVIQNNNEYHITFPFDRNIINLVKSIPGRRWNPENKYWSIPSDKLGFLVSTFKGTDYEDMVSIYSKEKINVNQDIDITQEIPDIDISNIPTYVNNKYQLYSHQIDFIKYFVDRQNKGNNKGFLVLDQMGCGKSIEAINLALYNYNTNKFKHCLILCCVNSSKYNWMEEVSFHTNNKFEGYILGSRKNKKGNINYNGSSLNKLEDLKSGYKYNNKDEGELPYFLILNVEAIRYQDKNKYKIADQLIKMINDGDLNLVVIDEVHKNLSPKSKQGTQLLKIKKKTEDRCMWLPMTGTPIVNRPTDLFLSLRLVEAHTENSSYNWNQMFAVFGGFGGNEIIGYKNLDYMKTLLYPNMIRRLKEDILDLPDKIDIVDYVDNSSRQNRLMREIKNEIWDNRDNIVKSLNPLSQFLRLRQVNGSPELVDDSININDRDYLSINQKLKRLLELVEEIVVKNGEKVVIFSNWVEPLKTIHRYLNSRNYKVCCFTGAMSEQDRQQHKQKFIEDPEYKIILGTIGALGTTHTLTVANNIIFYDEPWTAADKQQACDRCHRISANKTVFIHTLISKGTIDDKVHSILYSKDVVSKFIVDNIDVHSNPELFDLLLN